MKKYNSQTTKFILMNNDNKLEEDLIKKFSEIKNKENLIALYKFNLAKADAIEAEIHLLKQAETAVHFIKEYFLATKQKKVEIFSFSPEEAEILKKIEKNGGLMQYADCFEENTEIVIIDQPKPKETIVFDLTEDTHKEPHETLVSEKHDLIETTETIKNIEVDIVQVVKKEKTIPSKKITPISEKVNKEVSNPKSYTIEEKRQNLIKIISQRQKVFTSKELEIEYCSVYGKTFENENFARNNIYRFHDFRIIKRVPKSMPYQYGLIEWFAPSGNIIDKYK